MPTRTWKMNDEAVIIRPTEVLTSFFSSLVTEKLNTHLSKEDI